jgi:hypothetical protein
MAINEQRLRTGSPEVGLAGVAALRRLADELEPLHVHRAREAGWSWERIARRLDMSKQAVHKKYAARESEVSR